MLTWADHDLFYVQVKFYIGYQATSLSTYDFSTLYTTLPHNLIKEKLLDLIKRTFYKKEGELYLACKDKKAFFTSKDYYKGYQLWSCQNVCDALSFLLDNIYIRFGTKLYRQIVGIPMGTNCAPLVADLFLFCYERDFMKNLSSENQVTRRQVCPLMVFLPCTQHYPII